MTNPIARADDSGRIATWTNSDVDEQAMEDGHAPMWARLIELVKEPSLTGKDVLDFGCNQGGFLRLLHAKTGFRSAVGCDIASRSIEMAESRKGDLPVQYLTGSDLSEFPERFDIAFSHEVLFLIPDIGAHASDIYRALRFGGVYYAVTGCHTDNPEWPIWREMIRERTNLPTMDRSVNEYARAFESAGFSVGVRKFGLDDFLPVPRNEDRTSNIFSRLNYYDNVKVCFRMVKNDTL